MAQDEKDKKTIQYSTSSSGNELLQCFAGILLLGAGLYILSTRIVVHSSWYMWRIGSFDVSSGAVTIPLIIGIIWCVVDSKSIIAKILTTLSAIFIVISIILSVRLNFIGTSMFLYVVIFGMIAVGSGLIIKTLFKKRD